MVKKRLMTPGPTQVPESSLLALAKQVTHHRTEDFRRLMAEVLEGLRYTLQTQNEIAILASSGTGAMEAAVANIVSPGDKAIVLESGKFSERWGILCERFGAEVVRYEVPWGKPFDPHEVTRLLDAHGDAAAVYGTLLETSTGVVHDIEGIGRVVRDRPALFVVDGISGVGVEACATDAWGIDLLAVGGQKALMGLPGLAMLSVSEAAWRRIDSRRRPVFYFDLTAYREAARSFDTPFTPAKSLLISLAENLRLIKTEGLDAIRLRATRLAAATRAGMTALGLRFVAERPADGMTAVYLPEGIDAKQFRSQIEHRFGIALAGGQGPLKGKIFRIAHMGIIDELDIVGVVAAVELVLAAMGWAVEPGAGVTAVERILHAGTTPPSTG